MTLEEAREQKHELYEMMIYAIRQMEEALYLVATEVHQNPLMFDSSRRALLRLVNRAEQYRQF